MAEYILTEAPVLAGMDLAIGGRRALALTDLVLTSLAIPQDGATAAEAALGGALGLSLPVPGYSLADGGTRAIRLAPDQVLLVTADAAPAALTGPFYTTDQTGAWVVLELTGKRIDTVLERLSMLDVATFPVDGAQRTLVAHLSVLLVRLAEDRWWLMSAASSARSFAHAVETALNAVA